MLYYCYNTYSLLIAMLDLPHFMKSNLFCNRKMIWYLINLCLYLLQLISDAGFQGEITSISTAAQQIEVFSRVLKSAIVGFLQSSDDWQNSVNECAVCNIK